MIAPNGIGAETLAEAKMTDAATPAAPQMNIGTFGKVWV
jgi:hypothetical protein